MTTVAVKPATMAQALSEARQSLIRSLADESDDFAPTLTTGAPRSSS